MTTDENVVQFPKGKKDTQHGPEDNLYMAKVRTEQGELKMIIGACSIGCVFAAIMENLPEDSQIQSAVIMNVGVATGRAES